MAQPSPASEPADPALPDLLHPVPLRRIDHEETKLAIALAFASGVSGGLFTTALDKASVIASSFEPSAFAEDIFLRAFASQCFWPRGGSNTAPVSVAHLVKLLSHPPRDVGVVRHRRAILQELVEVPRLRDSLVLLYAELSRWRELLEGTGGVGRYDANRRRIEILDLLRRIVDRMATDFAGASSGLLGLSAFGKRLQQSEPYRSLCDLLRYEENLATLNLRVRVGADGRIRGFDILALQEDQQNPFVMSPLRRWLARLELYLRGYHFADGEVMARLIDAVFDGLHEDLVQLVQLVGDLEFYIGALAFRDAALAAGLAVCLPELSAAAEPRVLRRLYNPLLLAQGVTVVPCDVELDRHDVSVLVTGPNSGGKTRLLQALALTQLLAQCGCFVPAASGCVSLAPGMVVSLIQEVKVDQTEGRLGMELLRIRTLFERLPPGAMVILDELCSGTNPSEGEEIFELVLRMLTRLRPQTFITTHFLAFAARLEREGNIPELRFLQVELGTNQEPTYQFGAGVANTSLARQAAARLGVTGEQLMSLVDRNISASQNCNERGLA
jgi:DNA mismatch repair protein MutS2